MPHARRGQQSPAPCENTISLSGRAHWRSGSPSPSPPFFTFRKDLDQALNEDCNEPFGFRLIYFGKLTPNLLGYSLVVVVA
jgi:hypothetical protein